MNMENFTSTDEYFMVSGSLGNGKLEYDGDQDAVGNKHCVTTEGSCSIGNSVSM